MANTTDLTTLFLFKQFASLTETEDDEKLKAIISACSLAIAEYCQRTFLETTYKKWLDGTGEDWLLLPEWPIRVVYGISTKRNDVMTVKNTTAKWASVSVEDTLIRLSSISTAGVESLDNTYTWATYPTMTLLAAAINAVTGWSATVKTDQGTQPTILLQPGVSGYAVSPDDVDLFIADEIESVRLVPQTDRMIARVAQNSSSDDLFIGGSGVPFPAGTANIFAWYKAGYTLPTDSDDGIGLDEAGNVPKDLTMITNNIVKHVYDGSEQDLGPADQRLSASDYSYTIKTGFRGMLDNMIRKEYANALTPYKAIV